MSPVFTSLKERVLPPNPLRHSLTSSQGRQLRFDRSTQLLEIRRAHDSAYDFSARVDQKTGRRRVDQAECSVDSAIEVDRDLNGSALRRL